MELRCPKCGGNLPQGVPAWARQLKVGQVMTKNPVTLGPEDSLMQAGETMRRHSVRRLPVVMGDALVGIVAEGDLKRAAPSTLSDSQEDWNRVMEGTSISRIMIARPLTVVEETPLEEAVRTLAKTKYGSLPVLRDGKLVGIVTDSDLLKLLAELIAQAG